VAEEVLNEFASDTHRRVAGHLSRPRSANDLAHFLARHDPHVEDDAYDPEKVEEYLKDLEADGLVKNIGSGTAEELVAKVKADKDLRTLRSEKADEFAARAERSDVYPFPEDGDHWVLTQKFIDKVNAPIPGEPPPLSGPALEHAEAENAKLAEESEAAFREGLRAKAQALRDQADQLDKEAGE
jgi:hypothetical protein